MFTNGATGGVQRYSLTLTPDASGASLVVDTGGLQRVIVGESATLTANASGGMPPYSYAWSPAATLSSSTSATTVATPSSTTTYAVMVTDSGGATAMDDDRSCRD